MSNPEVLTDVVMGVLEDLAMVFADEFDPDDIEAAASGQTLEVSVDFRGPKCGSLHLLVSDELPVEIAANVLGLDEDDPDIESMLDDALKELANVTIGQCLTAMEGVEAVFDLSPPRLERGVEAGRWQEMLDQPCGIGVSVDGRPILALYDYADGAGGDDA